MSATSWDDLPKILLVAMPASGKTQTVFSWTQQFQTQRVTERGTIEVIETGDLPTRTTTIQQYIITIGDWSIGVIDVPGEIVDDASAEAGRKRGALDRICNNVRAVLAIAPPPLPADGHTGGARVCGYVHDANRYARGDVAQVDLEVAVNRLYAAISFAEKFLSRRSRGVITYAAQIGFADLCSFGKAEEEHRSRQAALRAMYQQLWPPRVPAADLLQRALLDERLPLYDKIDGMTRQVFQDFARGIGELLGADQSLWLFSCSATEALSLGTRSSAVGFLYLMDQVLRQDIIAHERRRQQEQAAREAQQLAAAQQAAAERAHLLEVERAQQFERERITRQQAAQASRQRWMFGSLAVTLLVGMLAIVAFATWSRAPYRLPRAIALRACENPQEDSTERRCQCLRVLFEYPDLDEPFEPRMSRLEPFRAGCWNLAAQGTLDAATASLLLHADLAKAIVAPASLCPARIEQAVQAGAVIGDGPSDRRYYPAMSSAEVQFVTWAYALVKREPAPAVETVRVAFSSSNAKAYENLRHELSTGAELDRCLHEWSAARASGDWHAVELSCQRAFFLLPVEVRATLEADLPAPPRIQKAASESTPDPVASTVGAACPGQSGVASLVLKPPQPDGLSLGNRAASAGSVLAYRRALDQQGSLSFLPGHRQLIELLTPHKSQDERIDFERKLTLSDLKAMLEFLQQAYLPLGQTKPVGPSTSIRADGRVPRLPSAHVADAVCALVEALATSPLLLTPLDAESLPLLRAQLAVALAAIPRRPMPREPSWCGLTANLTLMRSSNADDQKRALQSASAQLGQLAKNPTYAVDALDAQCHLWAEMGQVQEVDSVLAALGERDAKKQAACGARAVLWRLARQNMDAASDLFSTFHAAMSEAQSVAMNELLDLLRQQEDRDVAKIKESIKGLRAQLPGDAYEAAFLALEASLK